MLRRVIAIALLLAVAAPAFAIDLVAVFIDPNAEQLHVVPEDGQEVRLNAMIVNQKVEGGYLIGVNPHLMSNTHLVGATAFLKTKVEYDQSTDLSRRRAKWVAKSGFYTFTNVMGFKRTVYAFEEVAE